MEHNVWWLSVIWSHRYKNSYSLDLPWYLTNMLLYFDKKTSIEELNKKNNFHHHLTLFWYTFLIGHRTKHGLINSYVPVPRYCDQVSCIKSQLRGNLVDNRALHVPSHFRRVCWRYQSSNQKLEIDRQCNDESEKGRMTNCFQ